MTTTRILDYFSSLMADDDSLPLTEAALSLAQDAYPDLDMQADRRTRRARPSPHAR
jgi:hypothetical protein